MQKVEKILKVVAVSPCLSLITIFENRHFAFAAWKESADVFLVCKDNEQGNSNGKNPVGNVVHIENDQYKYRESHAGQYRTQGYKTG